MRTLTLPCDDLTPVRAYAAMRRAQGDGASFLFESVVGGERWGRYSILGFRPRYELRLSMEGWKVLGARPSFAENLEASSHGLGAIGALISRPAAKQSVAERIACSHVGYFAWDVVHAITKVEPWPSTKDTPLARLFGQAVVVVFDALAQTVTIAAPDSASLEETHALLDGAARLGSIALPDRARIPPNVAVTTDDASYEAMVRRAQEYIAAGDAFQVVLARSFRVAADGRDALDVYRAMRLINPSPYMYFLDMPPAGRETRMQILGASPETLVRLERPPGGGDRVMTVRPLAGTRRRGATEEEDSALEAELLADPKERAEHVMLIDLGRNDVGRVAETGTVQLARKMEIERFSHVMHIVSEVRGRIQDTTSAVDVLASAFPAGTLSGAPKLRAMQIIRELEGRPRGVYGGAVGYLGDELDFAIAIRTATCEAGEYEVTAGAGIVEASVPSAEADETRSKARGVLAAIEAARPADGATITS